MFFWRKFICKKSASLNAAFSIIFINPHKLFYFPISKKHLSYLLQNIIFIEILTINFFIVNILIDSLYM